jgi:drug/metabolite transporter (DMT)-like permease
MSSPALGAAAACGASCLYNVGVALQALEARATDRDSGLRASLLRRLASRRRWLAGTFLNVLGWPLQAVALLLAPLSVVQPALAFGLLVLLAVGASRLGERVGSREVLSTLGIIAGVAALAALAPAASARHAGTWTTLAVLGGLGALALAPYVLRRGARIRGGVAAAAAGLALAWSGLATKFVADALDHDAWRTVAAWTILTGLASGVGLLSEMTALQRAPATRVAPLVFCVQVAVPVALAPVLAAERLGHDPASTAATLAALAVVLAGAAGLLSSPAGPAALAASAETEAALSPRAPSRCTTAATSETDAASVAGTVTTTTSPGETGGRA